MIRTWLVLYGWYALCATTTNGAHSSSPQLDNAPTRVFASNIALHILSFLLSKTVSSPNKDSRQALIIIRSRELFDAVDENNPRLLSQLLGMHADASVTNRNGFTPFEVAMQRGLFDCARALMLHYTSSFLAKILNWSPLHCAVHDRNLTAILESISPEQINSQDELNTTPLHLAAKIGEIDIINALLMHSDINVNIQDMTRSTPLDWALEKPDNHQVVTALMKHGAALGKTDSTTWTLHSAAWEGNSSKVAYLLSINHYPTATDNYGNTPLHMAAFNGHYDVVKLLLENLPNVNVTNNNGTTPLYFAAQNGHIPVLKLLLEHGTEINKARADGTTSLCIASQNGHTQTVKLLLEHGADIDKALSSGGTPLYIASQNGHPQTVKLLLEHGAEINKALSCGATPLYIASQYGHIPVVKLLLEHGADIKKARSSGATPLYIASQNGQVSAVKLLLEHGADINKALNNGTTSLCIASEVGHISVVKLLLAHRADISKARNDRATPLYIASHYDHISVVKLLLEHGADINKAHSSGATPLFIASQLGHYDVVFLLLAHGADINSQFKEWTPIHIAVKQDHYDIAALLLDRGADVVMVAKELFLTAVAAREASFARELMGKLDGAFLEEKCAWSPLHHAAYFNDAVEIQRLLAAGADPAVRDAFGSTAVHYAVWGGNIDAVRALSDSDANVVDNSQQTPLHLAARKGWGHIVSLLAVTVNAQDSNMKTPLHLAAYYGHLDSVKQLVAVGAEIDALDSHQLTPVQLAARNGHWQVVKFLANSGADIEKPVWCDDTLLHAAAASGQDTFIAEFGHCFNVNAVDLCGLTPLHYAARHRNHRAITALVAQQANVDARDSRQQTPLHYAAHLGYKDLVYELIDAGANIAAQDSDGLTPPILAAQAKHYSLIRIFLEQGGLFKLKLGALKQA